MTDDGIRQIRLFQVCDLFMGQFNGQSADGIFQMREPRCPDDRRRHRLLLECWTSGTLMSLRLHSSNAEATSPLAAFLRESSASGGASARF
jgi:hypothetical protein